jgi:hypothetical protein
MIRYTYTASYIYTGPNDGRVMDTTINASNSYVASYLASSIGAQNCSLRGSGDGALKEGLTCQYGNTDVHILFGCEDNWVRAQHHDQLISTYN